MMDIRPIRNEADLSWALREVARYFDREPAEGTPEADRFEVLTTLIEAYESRHHPIPESDPVEILRFAIEERGHSRADLDELLGSPAIAEDVLDRRQGMTLEQVRAVSEAWHIPIAALTRPYALASRERPRPAA